MHYQTLLLLSLSALPLSLSSPLEERMSYPWVSAFDNTNFDCAGTPPKSQPYVKLKKEGHCYQFAPSLENIGWSWGAGSIMTVSRIKFYSDAKCAKALLWADMKNDTNKHGYCLTTKQYQDDYPKWDPNNPPILSIMSGSDDSED